jgi:subfamily B ATP-binding cassette protein MsbA
MWYGSSLVFRGALDAGTFLAFIFAFYNIITPSKVFSNAYYNVQKGLAALQRMDRILSATDTVPEVKMPSRLDRFQNEIRFDHVSFRYTGSVETVLDDVDLVIPKGMSMALVGASGAGKSTLVDLIPRFYDVNEGRITIDGIDVRQIAIKDLRVQIGIVSQEPILFNDTIYNNIVFGKEGVSREQVVEAAKVAHAHEFIEQLENGYDTNIGDRGVKLSGGQRQRITIARAILKDPPILILDEATSALDSESEKLVQDALLTVMKGRTSIVIAHRLSTIQHADLIVVLKEGKIVQKGTHLELLEQQDGEYRKFVSLQAF